MAGVTCPDFRLSIKAVLVRGAATGATGSVCHLSKQKTLALICVCGILIRLPQQGPLWELKLQLRQLELLLQLLVAVVSAAAVVTEGQQLPFP